MAPPPIFIIIDVCDRLGKFRLRIIQIYSADGIMAQVSVHSHEIYGHSSIVPTKQENITIMKCIGF